MKETSENSIANSIVAGENDEWNHAEDQHEVTEHQVDAEMAANKKTEQAAKSDHKSQESKGTPA